MIYLDHQATTPVDPRVLQAMLPYFSERFGNPSSRTHRFGWEAADAVARARAQLVSLLNAQHEEIVFTSSATESNNCALRGVLLNNAAKPAQLITVSTEHPSVLNTARALREQGIGVTFLGVDSEGRIRLDELSAALSSQTVLVSIMAANSETGVLQDIPAIAALVHERGALLHTDATQACGKIPVDVRAWDVDLLSLAGHKMYAPKGVGALFVRSAVQPKLRPLLSGSGQEAGLRAGTSNVPGIVGLGAAAQLAIELMPTESPRIGALRDQLERRLMTEVEGVVRNGSAVHRLPHVANLSFAGVAGEELLTSLPGLALSAGSACRSGSGEPSYVLTAMGVPAELAQAALRFGLGRDTTSVQIDSACEQVAEAVEQLRQLQVAD